MSFNADELLKIQKATSGIFKANARKAVKEALFDLAGKLDSVEKLAPGEKEQALKSLLIEATAARKFALNMGANGYGDPEWASAAVCESWLLEELTGDPSSQAKVAMIVSQMMAR